MYELQEIDLDLGRKAEALHRVVTQLSGNKALEKAEAELEQERQSLARLEKEQRSGEWEAEDIRAKCVPAEKKLYSGSVKNPKELVSLQQDVAALKARIREKEDKVLEIMGQVEEMKAKVADRTVEVGGLRRKWEEGRRELAAERTRLEALLAEGQQKRQALCASVGSAALELYEFLRGGKQGQAVVRVEQGRCQGCRITLPLNELQRVRMDGELVQCNTCERILYLPLR